MCVVVWAEIAVIHVGGRCPTREAGILTDLDAHVPVPFQDVGTDHLPCLGQG